MILKLTRPDGKHVYVNSEFIIKFDPMSIGRENTQLDLFRGYTAEQIKIKEDADQIYGLINQQGSNHVQES